MAGSVRKQVGNDLTEGSVYKLLLAFAAPMVLTNLVQQLYSMVDLIIIGKFVGSIGTVGVSTGGELSDLMTPLATGFAMAGQVYIAQLAGAKDHARIQSAISTLITLMLGMSAVCMVITFAFSNQILHALNCPEEAFSQAASYMLITVAGMPFVFGYNAVCAILRGMGESKKPLMFVVVAATVNIFADLLMVAVFKLEAAGTAIATVVSQIGAFGAAFHYMYQRREHLGFRLQWSYFRMEKHDLGVIMKLGIPQLVRIFAVQGSMLWVKSNVNSYGLVVSATYSVGSKIEKFMDIFIQGVNNAGGAMIGQNLGARKLGRVKEIMYKMLLTSMAVAVVVCVLFLLIPSPLYAVFTDDLAVIEYGSVFLRIMSVGCLVVGFAGPFKSISTGAGAAGLCLVIGVMDGATRVLTCLICANMLHLGAESYFWGAALCQLIPGIIAACYYYSGKWKTKKLLSE